MIEKLTKAMLKRSKKFLKRNVERMKKPSLFKEKVFCISIQRTGTTSVGDFLSDHGYRVARWGDSNFYKWPYYYVIGDYESIFRSNLFKAYNAFEDGPWFYGDFYRAVFHRFPNSKFILLERDSDRWFDSMLKHSNKKVLGNTYRHCKNYRRLTEFYNKIDSDPQFKPAENSVDNLISLEGKREFYIIQYEEYNRDVKEFFNRYAPDRLYTGRLENPEKWMEIGDFLGIKVQKEYDVHSNKSKLSVKI